MSATNSVWFTYINYTVANLTKKNEKRCVCVAGLGWSELSGIQGGQTAEVCAQDSDIEP